MKKIFIQHLLVLSAAVMFNSYLPAQTSHSTSPFVIVDPGKHSALLESIKAKNEKTYRHLTRTYPEAIINNVRQEKDGTFIKASLNGNMLKVKYDIKGKFINAVLSYPCKDLDEKIADQVMEAYPGFAVFGQVLDVTVGNESVLLVMIENRKSWKRVRLTKDGMDVYEEYVKSF